MSAYWPFFVGGAALAGIMLGHWVLLRRMMTVSGRYSAIVDRLRLGPKGAPPSAAGPAEHAIFFGAITVGGLVAALTSSRFSVSPTIRGEGFDRLVHGSPILAVVALLVGGALVGFGTRMAGGCTSGHGLCGVSRLQPGSLLATAAFFGTGVAVSFLLGWLA